MTELQPKPGTRRDSTFPCFSPVFSGASATDRERVKRPGSKNPDAQSKGEDLAVRVTQVQIPDVDISELRHRMGLSLATKFGFPPATLRKTGSRGEPALMRRRVCCWR